MKLALVLANSLTIEIPKRHLLGVYLKFEFVV